MRLQPNIGSDRSWVWKVAADYSESPPTAETLAIRFANADSKLNLVRHFNSNLTRYPFPDAAQFKTQFEDAQKTNASLAGQSVETKADEPEPEEDDADEDPAEPTEGKPDAEPKADTGETAED